MRIVKYALRAAAMVGLLVCIFQFAHWSVGAAILCVFLELTINCFVLEEMHLTMKAMGDVVTELHRKEEWRNEIPR